MDTKCLPLGIPSQPELQAFSLVAGGFLDCDDSTIHNTYVHFTMNRVHSEFDKLTFLKIFEDCGFKRSMKIPRPIPLGQAKSKMSAVRHISLTLIEAC